MLHFFLQFAKSMVVCLKSFQIAFLINKLGLFHKESKVAVTPPSTEFSIGTTAASQSLLARCSTTDLMPGHGINSGSESLSSLAKVNAACSA